MCIAGPGTDPARRPPRTSERESRRWRSPAGATSDDDVAIFCRNTTEAINHLAYRLRLEPRDVVVTTVIEHHANLLPWARLCDRRFVECGVDGTFTVERRDGGARRRHRAPGSLAISGASNVTGWRPPLEEIIDAAHARGVPVLVDAAQLAPHAPLPTTADYLAWSGHKMYAPFGAGVLIGPRATFAEGDPFLAGGGAVDLVDLDEVVWTDPPDREEAGSPNVLGAVALDAAVRELHAHRLARHRRPRRRRSGPRSRPGLAGIPGVRLLGPPPETTDTLARWRPSSSRESPTPWWPPGSAPSSGSASAMAASAPTPTCSACSTCRPRRSPPTATPSWPATAARSPAPSGPAPASRPRRPTSTAFSAVVAIASGGPAPFDYQQDPGTGDYWPVDRRAGLDGPGAKRRSALRSWVATHALAAQIRGGERCLS